MMTRNKCLLFCFFVLMSVSVCWLVGYANDPIDQEYWTTRAKNELKPFKQKLMGALAEGLQEGPESAIEVCQILAPEIASEICSEEVEVGRTSHKLRNEENAPREWMKPLLNAYATTPNKSEPEVVPLAHGGVGYVEPIFVKPMCLACHGGAIAPSVAARIDEQYPEDKARNFKVGDFRGLFWVEFKEKALDSK